MPSILGANTLSSGYDVGNSVRFNRADSAILNKTFDDDGTHHDKGTISLWIKRNELGAEEVLFSAGANNREFIRFESNDTLTYRSVAESYHLNTNRVFRDVSAWYHIVVAFDSSQGTASNRNKIYVNGVQETSFATETYTPNQNMDHKLLSGELNSLGKDSEQNTFAACYFCEVVGIDGVAHDPTSFGEFDEDSGIWKPKSVSGLTFGTNGFHLNFADSSALGTDVSGNGNNFANTNLAATDQSTDTCTNNFATFNGLLKQMSTMALTEGNLQGATSSSHEAFFGSFFSSIGVTTGKWYAEFKCTGNANRVYVGISSNLEADILGSSGSAYTFAYKGNGWAYGGQDGKIAHTNSNTFLDYGAALSNNDILGVALDLDELEIYFSVNGSFQNSGDPTSGSSQTGGVVTAGAKVLNGSGSTGTYYFCVSDNDQSTVCTVQANFGSPIHSISSGNADGNGYGNFEYAVPSGYFALCTKNLAEYGG